MLATKLPGILLLNLQLLFTVYGYFATFRYQVSNLMVGTSFIHSYTDKQTNYVASETFVH